LGGVTMGQILCFLMIIAGFILLRFVTRDPIPEYY
jgi:prolipoprotein diacylglyceryltransferase